MMPTTMPNESVNQPFPHRVTTNAENPRASPTPNPRRGSSGGEPGPARRPDGSPACRIWAMAKANTALRKKLAAVIATTARRRGISSGPRTMSNCLPRNTWTLRSSIATQIHMAGRIWIRVSRQLVTRSLTPWKSTAKAPTTRASGASHRLRWLRESTALLDLVVVALPDRGDQAPEEAEETRPRGRRAPDRSESRRPDRRRRRRDAAGHHPGCRCDADISATRPAPNWEDVQLPHRSSTSKDTDRARRIRSPDQG